MRMCGNACMLTKVEKVRLSLHYCEKIKVKKKTDIDPV